MSPALGGELSSPSSVAVDQSNGHIYVLNAGMLRIEEFTSTGGFVRTFGLDVVASGSEQADEEQAATVNATAGQYKLTFGANTTTDIDWNEPAPGIEAKLNALESINTDGGNVTVSGGPGGSDGATPYLIKFGGARAGVDQSEITVSAGTVALTGTAAVATLNEGGSGYEICNTAASCKAGATGVTGGALAAGTLAVPSVSTVPRGGTAPNQGNVLVAEPRNNRVQEFSPAGAFIRTFGWGVVASGPDNKNFASGPDRADEVLKLVVRATDGKFKLGFGGEETDELDYNASPDQVKDELNELGAISAGGGSVSVAPGGSGDATGSAPYIITFDGGPMAGINHEAFIEGINVSLTGGTPVTAVFSYVGSRGGQGFEVCRKDSLDICKAGEGDGSGKGLFGFDSLKGAIEDASGNIYTLEREGASTSDSFLPQIATRGLRVQKFTLLGDVPTPNGTF